MSLMFHAGGLPVRSFAFRGLCPLLSLAFTLSPLTALAVFGNPSYVDTTRYRSVGELGSMAADGSFSSTASAVAIDPFWILTARHVDGDSFRVNGQVYHAVEDVADTDSDLRLIRLDRALDDYTKLAQFDALSRQVTLVGFGGTGSGVNGTGYNVGLSDGLRHTAVNVVDGVESLSFSEDQMPWPAYYYDLDDPNGGDGYVVGEGGLWAGDSGGGWFVDTVDGPQLVAISSAVFNPAYEDGSHANEFGSYGFGTRLSDRMAFIGQHVPGAVPEPATFAMVGLGFLAMLRRRRRLASQA
jgi:hypothetical protein